MQRQVLEGVLSVRICAGNTKNRVWWRGNNFAAAHDWFGDVAFGCRIVSFAALGRRRLMCGVHLRRCRIRDRVRLFVLFTSSAGLLFMTCARPVVHWLSY